MNSQDFSLKPFQSAGLPSKLEITGNIRRSFHTLSLSYALLGTLAEVVSPPAADVPGRRNGLWEETCFEFFLGMENSDLYWEFNLSPAGHWNVYRFTSYREGMQEELAFTSLLFSVGIQPDALWLSLKLDLDKIIPAEQALEIGVSAVIKTIDGKTTYWALTHPGTQADFHLRDSFIIKL